MGRKRKSGEGTIRLRKDGRWEGRVVISYDDKGLPKTKNVLAKTKTECVAKLESLKESVAPATAVKIKADMPFGEWVEFWYENYSKPMLRPSSQRSYPRKSKRKSRFSLWLIYKSSLRKQKSLAFLNCTTPNSPQDYAVENYSD